MLKRCISCRISSRLSQHTARGYSSIATASRETVTVANGSNGSISLDIHQPLAAAPLSAPRVLIYLPRGPDLGFAGPDSEESVLSTLTATLPYTVVCINYRWDNATRFPTPVHDVLRGFDWIADHLLPRRAIARAGRPEHAGKIAVCGELMGAGLATMLALTECRVNETGIVAAAINNPLVDWVDLASATTKKTRGASLASATRSESPPINAEIAAARDVFFRIPEHYFDPFASPLLFFRTAGVEVPQPKRAIPRDEFGILSMINQEDFHRQQLALSAMSTVAVPDEVVRPQKPRTSRRASRRFPGARSGLRLPRFHISAGDIEPYTRQATELSLRVRESHMRQAGGDDFGRKVLLDEELDAMDQDEHRDLLARDALYSTTAVLQLHEGSCLWNRSATGRSSLLQSINWLRNEMS